MNRSSIREALHRLEAWGLVEVRHGGGTRVRDFLVSAGLQILPFLLAPAGQLDPSLLSDVLEMRTMLLGWTAARAAERSDDASVAALDDVLSRLEQATDPTEVQALDFEFYECLVEMTGNRVLAMLAHGFREVYLENRELFALLYHQFDTRHHRAAFEAIRDGDPTRAAAAMDAYGLGALALGDPR